MEDDECTSAGFVVAEGCVPGLTSFSSSRDMEVDESFVAFGGRHVFSVIEDKQIILEIALV